MIVLLLKVKIETSDLRFFKAILGEELNDEITSDKLQKHS
jgi:hypothetical protein